MTEEATMSLVITLIKGKGTFKMDGRVDAENGTIIAFKSDPRQDAYRSAREAGRRLVSDIAAQLLRFNCERSEVAVCTRRMRGRGRGREHASHMSAGAASLMATDGMFLG